MSDRSWMLVVTIVGGTIANRPWDACHRNGLRRLVTAEDSSSKSYRNDRWVSMFDHLRSLLRRHIASSCVIFLGYLSGVA